MISKVGITTSNSNAPESGKELCSLRWTYINAVARVGGLPFLLPPLTDENCLKHYVETCDGFILSGGIDVTPCCYGELPHQLLGETNLRLDRSQISLIQRIIDRRKPFIAICRGSQILNVACGGTLHQDNSLQGDGTANHMTKNQTGDISHPITIRPDTVLHTVLGDRIWVNSYHHQSIKAVGKGLKISAVADDGIIEAVELIDYPYGIGVQWHPEAMLAADDSMLPLFSELIKTALSQTVPSPR